MTMSDFDAHFMRMALREAARAAEEGEVPLGCVVVEPAVIEPAPISPKPPALLTAEASFQPLHHTMPPAMMGYSIPKSSVILLFIFFFII